MPACVLLLLVVLLQHHSRCDAAPAGCAARGTCTAADFQWHSQAGQDQYVVDNVYGHSFRGGYFVEVGAADGRMLSNALSLEESFGWTGICVEPSRQYAALVRSGRRCIKRSEPLSDVSGTIVEFVEDTYGGDGGVATTSHNVGASVVGTSTQTSPNDYNLFSGIVEFLDTYTVLGEVSRKVTRTLTEIMDESQAPAFVHFLSLDTEGSELAILQKFAFDRYTFGVIAVEHNHADAKREGLRLLLEAHGYFRTLCIETDDIYVHSTVVELKGVGVDRRGCKAQVVVLPCPSSSSSSEAAAADDEFEAACAAQHIEAVSMRQIRAKMLAPDHECTNAVPGKLLRLPLVFDASFPFVVTLGEVAHTIALYPSDDDNLAPLAGRFCAEHELDDASCGVLLDELQKFVRNELLAAPDRSVAGPV